MTPQDIFAKYQKRTNHVIHKDVTIAAPIVIDNSRQVRFVISAETVDTDADLISVSGWQLDVFRRNPVVLWGHDMTSLPIAKVVDLGVEGNALMATVEFAPFDTPVVGEKAEAILQLIRGGFLSGCSVGFLAQQYELSDRQTPTGRPGLNILKATLMELSIVTVPANSDCLVVDRPQFSGAVDPSQAVMVRNQRQRRAHKALLLSL